MKTWKLEADTESLNLYAAKEVGVSRAKAFAAKFIARTYRRKKDAAFECARCNEFAAHQQGRLGKSLKGGFSVVEA